jgi:hypothetical protein
VEGGASMSTVSILKEIRVERKRQDAKHGPEQNLPDGTGTLAQKVVREHAIALTDIRAERGTVSWCDVLTEEVAEALAESDEDKLRKELIQSAAVCVKWIEAIDRRKGTIG